MLRKRPLIVLATAVMALTLSCRSEPSSGASGKPTLVVGSILSKTGPAAAYGTDADRGAQLALQVLEKGDLPFIIRYIPHDDRSDRTEAVKAARTLIESSGAQVLLGPAISSSALSVGKLAQERSIPMVGTSPTQDEVTASDTYDRTFVFRVCFNDSYQGEVLAKFAREHLGLTRIATIYDKTLSYSIGLAKTFRARFEALGGTVVQEENYSVQDVDYSSLVAKVERFDVDGLFIPGWDENVGPMLKQAGSRWRKFAILGPDGWTTDRLLELAGGNVGNSFAISHFLPDDPDERVKAFRQTYLERYGEDPTAFAALGYDAMFLIADAAKRARSFSGGDLRDALAATRALSLVTGSITFDAKRNPRKDAVVVRLLPDRFRFERRLAI